MWRYVLLLVGAGVMSIGAIHLITKTGQLPTQATVSVEKNQESQQVSTAQPATKKQNPLGGRRAHIPMNSRGQFLSTARMNGRKVNVLVDTGATSVAINKSTARRLGIRTVASDFTHNIHTANGVTRGALVEIDRIEVGRISVRNVRALVVQDKSLSGTLLGMSFLSQLRKFEISNQTLVLTQ